MPVQLIFAVDFSKYTVLGTFYQ